MKVGLKARSDAKECASPIAHAVFVHGAGGGSCEWRLWRGVWATYGIEVTALDLLPSRAGLAATTFDDYRRQVIAAIDALPRPRVLVGASLGGLLALVCADAADALVLVNPLPPVPWSAQLPARDWADVVPWRRNARLSSTRQALPDADEASALLAFRHWRDESGAVLREAQGGIAVTAPRCRVLCIASMHDEDVPPALTVGLANAWQASVLRVPSISHVGPLLGRGATAVAVQAAQWLSAR